MVDLTRDFLEKMPKAELHVHIEGTLEPKLKLELAERNHVELAQKTIEEVKATLQYDNLADFLAVYYEAMQVLQTKQDFYDLAMAYLKKAAKNNVCHVEMFFDPQAHESRGIRFETVLNGLYQATVDARALNVDAHLVMCFLRDYSRNNAQKTLEKALQHQDKILGIGLDSDEHNNPPMKFYYQFAKAGEAGFHITAHADVDQVDSIVHIKDLLEVINAERIDHGTNIVENENLVAFAAKQKVGFTSCPLSNGFLSPDLKGNEVKYLLEQGVRVCLNSDDPAYFGGYITDNYEAEVEKYNLSADEVKALAANSFKMSWISEEQKQFYLEELDRYFEEN